MGNIFKVMIIVVAAGIVISAAALWLCDRAVRRSSKGYTFDTTDELPQCKAALVLGTASRLADGGQNPYFTYRMDAAAKLYSSGKVEYLVVSGDNSRKGYNEPLDMEKALLERGVPRAAIYFDFAGFRTLDSVIRMREIFGQEKYIVVSQMFHNERAIYLARRHGMEVWGYNARDVGERLGFRTNVREKFARVKMFLDLMTGKEPKFLGEPVILGEPQKE